MSSNAADAEVLLYTGAGGEIVPDNVVRVRVDPSVKSIPYEAFYQRKKLTEVELCEGLVEIGEGAFRWCDHSITKINIPTSLRRIKDYAFMWSLQTPIRLHDGIESIGKNAFAHCIFTNFRVPPLITVLPEHMLSNCKSLFSLELPEIMREIRYRAFYHCYCLRNVAFPPDAVFGDEIFIIEGSDTLTDLLQLFGSIAEIISELQHRFDGLPIHSTVYYQSYHEGVLQNLIAAINMRSGQRRTLSSELDPTGNQQDCLGMTPLHILACSSVHNLEMYRLIVHMYPTNLITEDRWGATPLLYAFWGAAPTEIIQFLLDSYKLLYPNHLFNWTMMVKTMGRTDTPKESIENLLCVKQMQFPDQPLDWEYLLDEFVKPSDHSFGVPFRERMRFLVMCGMSDRVEALTFKVWRDYIKSMVYTAYFKHCRDNSAFLHQIREKLAHFEEELPKLKEITTILELAFWKLRMNGIPPEETTHCQKKIKTDESSMRRQCRITCGADVVIRHVLPYLITVADEESDSYVESDSFASSDDESDEESDSHASSDEESSDSIDASAESDSNSSSEEASSNSSMLHP
jgi:hypothetical protein